MKTIFTILLVFLCLKSFSQENTYQNLITKYSEDTIKARLIYYALRNPLFGETQALVDGAKLEQKQAGTAWLNNVIISGNINELVINNTQINGIAAATLYPKYNFGVNIPLGIFTNQQKNIAAQRVKQYEAVKEVQRRQIIKDVLTKWATLKDKEVQITFQKQIVDGQRSNYENKQKEFANGDLQDVNLVNKEFELWKDYEAKLSTKVTEAEIARLDLEEVIGVPLNEVLK